jgi:Fe-S-cluster formation regulator IscX/YfhJ
MTDTNKIAQEVEMAKAEYKDDIKDLVKEMEAFKKEYQKKGQKILQTAFTQFFDENPSIQTITWSQYTPYFNDGDECVFRINGFYCSAKKLTAEDINSPYDLEGYEDDENDGYKWDSPARKKVQAFEKLLQPLEEVFKELFDDHVWVIATEDGFEVNEYEHE